MSALTVSGPYKYAGDIHASFRVDSPDRIVASVYASDGEEASALYLAQMIVSIVDQNGWFDISTAPKDGTVIFGCDAENGYDAKVVFINGEWECVDYDQFCMNVGFYPTHWRHLPKPPLNSSQIAVSSADHAQTEPAARSGEKSAATNPKGDA